MIVAVMKRHTTCSDLLDLSGLIVNLRQRTTENDVPWLAYLRYWAGRGLCPEVASREKSRTILLRREVANAKFSFHGTQISFQCFLLLEHFDV